MKIYEYIEFDMDVNRPLIDQLNEKGNFGMKFICMAQKIDNRSFDFKTGHPKMVLTLIYEREILKEVQPKENN